METSCSEFVPAMKFAALSDMVGIKEKTLKKLSKQQSSYRIKASIFVQGNEKMAEELVEMFKRQVILKMSYLLTYLMSLCCIFVAGWMRY
ncbi:PREDICTED: uncharacterized protein LOC106341978 isoform X1 [Brassica oleracea var. oleracea]|uniref:uncharacterized protein LOC106341978 isoform X1 n=1 Tax=Brassica oleracea var. oleracea TaxID=109376 RepID=UPI0006A72A3A|nr:PREDICTED: uncharacterized protein LOC106341978 isoform X1 [Brassica oleracea var. oleracea]